MMGCLSPRLLQQTTVVRLRVGTELERYDVALVADVPVALHAPCAPLLLLALVTMARGCARLLRNCEVHIAPRPRRVKHPDTEDGGIRQPPVVCLRVLVPRRTPPVRDPMRRCRLVDGVSEEHATSLTITVHPCVLRRLQGVFV